MVELCLVHSSQYARYKIPDTCLLDRQVKYKTKNKVSETLFFCA